MEEQKTKQSVQDTLVLSVNPQHEENTECDNVKIKDVSNTISENINPLIEDDLKKILVESTT